KPLRSVGFRAINLRPKTDTAFQVDLFGNTLDEDREELIEESIIKVRDKFGKSSIKRAVSVDKET
ncbi:MAG: hypothetical protein IJT84_01835, partial [Clostridia bacterium]|nr:hypothetical protein [Clostridia bacterium]